MKILKETEVVLVQYQPKSGISAPDIHCDQWVALDTDLASYYGVDSIELAYNFKTEDFARKYMGSEIDDFVIHKITITYTTSAAV
jgi:hypothetical protein